MEHPLMTPEQAAEKLLVKPNTVKSWLREGKLKGFKAGKLWRIPTQELNRFLNLNLNSLSS